MCKPLHIVHQPLCQSHRLTAITIMYHGGKDTKQICKITKHKNEESLKHYIDGQTSENKRKCTEVSTNGFNTSASTDLVYATQSTIAAKVSQTSNQTCQSSKSIATQNIRMNSLQNFRYPSINFNVTGGNCNFHFHYTDSTNMLQ